MTHWYCGIEVDALLTQYLLKNTFILIQSHLFLSFTVLSVYRHPSLHSFSIVTWDLNTKVHENNTGLSDSFMICYF